jgi:hypothetical protein
MTTPNQEGLIVENVSEGESGDTRGVENAITPEFVKQNFARLRDLVREQERNEKLKEVTDGVLQYAAHTQEGTTSKHVGCGGTLYPKSVENIPLHDQPTPRRTLNLVGERRSERFNGRGKEPCSEERRRERNFSPIRKMTSLAEPRRPLFQTEGHEGRDSLWEEEEDTLQDNRRRKGKMWGDDLVGPYQRRSQSRFTRRITMAPRPSHLKMSSHVKPYDGLRDPDDHMNLFCAAAENNSDWTMPVWCHMFEQTLVGPARLWFNSLPPGSIDSFDELQDSFEAHFMHQKRYERDPVEIHNIRQGDNEPILDFLRRFNRETMEIKGVTEGMRVSGYMHAIRNKQLIEQLNRVVPRTMKEAEERSRDFVRGKEAAALVDDYRRRDTRVTLPRQREPHNQGWSGPVKGRSEWYGEERRSKPRVPYDVPREEVKRVFTALIKTPCEILATEDVAKKFSPPTPGKNLTGPTDRYCEYHQGTGHNTNDCFQLKRKIEAAVQSGELAHLVRNIRSTNDRSHQSTRKFQVSMIRTSDNVARLTYPDQDWMKTPITFRQRDQCSLTHKALVISARTRETVIEQILIDTGATTGVIYEHFFHKLPGRVKESAVRTDVSLEAFCGAKHRPLGKISLPITLGSYPLVRTERLDFYIVTGGRELDMIMGRPGLLSFRAIPSVIHSIMMFPTRSGVAMVGGI